MFAKTQLKLQVVRKQNSPGAILFAEKPFLRQAPPVSLMPSGYFTAAATSHSDARYSPLFLLKIQTLAQSLLSHTCACVYLIAVACATSF